MTKTKKKKKEKRVALKPEVLWEGELDNTAFRVVKKYDEYDVKDWLDHELEDDDDGRELEAEIIIERNIKDAMGHTGWSETSDDYYLSQIIQEMAKLLKPKPKKKATKKKAKK